MAHAQRIVLVFLAIACAAGCGRDQGSNYGTQVATAYDRGKASGASGDLTTISQAVTLYLDQEGSLPEASSITELAELLSPTFVARLPARDPWGGAYHYWTDGTTYRVRSAGHDKKMDSDDDLELADGQVVKMPKGYTTFEGQ